MLYALMIGEDRLACETIRLTVNQHCRDISFKGMTTESSMVWESSNPPDMVFWDSSSSNVTSQMLHHPLPPSLLHYILVSETPQAHGDWGRMQVCLHKPLTVQQLALALSQGRLLLEISRSLDVQQQMLNRLIQQRPSTGLVGIPTEEGMQFIPAPDILRCEGINKYTLIVTCDGQQMVSSYNIGEFARQFQAHSFFSPHRSHLINLRHIRKLTLDNQIILSDGSQVPLSRRRRQEFVDLFRMRD